MTAIVPWTRIYDLIGRPSRSATRLRRPERAKEIKLITVRLPAREAIAGRVEVRMKL